MFHSVLAALRADVAPLAPVAIRDLVGAADLNVAMELALLKVRKIGGGGVGDGESATVSVRCRMSRRDGVRINISAATALA